MGIRELFNEHSLIHWWQIHYKAHEIKGEKSAHTRHRDVPRHAWVLEASALTILTQEGNSSSQAAFFFLSFFKFSKIIFVNRIDVVPEWQPIHRYILKKCHDTCHLLSVCPHFSPNLI